MMRQLSITYAYIDGLVQERSNSSALVMELRFLALTHQYGVQNKQTSQKANLWSFKTINSYTIPE